MKNIFLLLLLIIGNTAFAQVQAFEKHLREELKADPKLKAADIERNVSQRMQMVQLGQAELNATSSDNIFQTDNLANLCTNMGFEDSADFNSYTAFGWKGFGADTFGATGFVANTLLSGLVPSHVVTGFQNQTIPSTLNGQTFGGRYHAIVNAGMDPNITTLPTSISGKSLRLGNDNPNNGAEIISKTFIVPAGMDKFKFQYATVCVPDGTGKPGFFSAKAVSANGTIVSEIKDIGESSNPFFIHLGNFFYRPWHVAELDVSSLVGQQVTIVLINTDCFVWGHKQYIYLDDFCTTENNMQEGFITINQTEKCQKFPFALTGTLMVPNIRSNPAQQVSVKLKFYQSGVLVGTKVFTPTSPTGFSINITQADVPNFNACMDVVAELSYQIKDMTGTLRTITQTSGSPNNGFTSGPNNDICLNCVAPSCCKNNFSVVTPSVVPESRAGEGFTYSVEAYNVNVPNTIPITEIRVNVESFELISKYEDCLKCYNPPTTLGSVFGLWNIGSGANTLTNRFIFPSDWSTGKGNPNEVTWSNPRGVMLNTDDSFRLVYLFPEASEIPCCVDSAKICLRISYTDVNCGRCEIRTCSTVPLTNLTKENAAQATNGRGKTMKPQTLEELLKSTESPAKD